MLELRCVKMNALEMSYKMNSKDGMRQDPSLFRIARNLRSYKFVELISIYKTNSKPGISLDDPC